MTTKLRTSLAAVAATFAVAVAATPAHALKVPKDHPGSENVSDCRSGKYCVNQRSGEIDLEETCIQFNYWWCRL